MTYLNVVLVSDRWNCTLTHYLDILCTIVMVHNGTNSSYRSIDWIGLWSCFVYLYIPSLNALTMLAALSLMTFTTLSVSVMLQFLLTAFRSNHGHATTQTASSDTDSDSTTFVLKYSSRCSWIDVFMSHLQLPTYVPVLQNAMFLCGMHQRISAWF